MSAPSLRQYSAITANYWAFTLTDGALRMLILLHFYQQGYNSWQMASLFLGYEALGLITNILGGYWAARVGLNRTLYAGLALQCVALALLLAYSAHLSLALVMGLQGVCGIAKDLNKMSAKTSLKFLARSAQQSHLFRLTAFLTGSKNALKGVGFFLGGWLLQAVGLQGALLALLGLLLITALLSMPWMQATLGVMAYTPKFKTLFSPSAAIQFLSAARCCLFAARDVWFAIALPVFLSQQLGWHFSQVGAFMALWIIGYGAVQSLAPLALGNAPQPRQALYWAIALAAVTAGLCVGLYGQWPLERTIIIGLTLFGILFAVNSSLHSYLIVHLAQAEKAALDVGFYYMANALGRLMGTLLSGFVFHMAGLMGCLLASLAMVLFSAGLTLGVKAPAH